MTKDEAKTVCVQPAQDLRSFPEAADGRPMPPIGDELMTAGLNCEDARFVAIQLAQNGLTLAPAEQGGAEVERWKAAAIQKDKLHGAAMSVVRAQSAENESLRDELTASAAEIAAMRAENKRLIRLIRLAHPVMRECGWQLAPACAAEGSDGILEAACAEIEEEFGDMLRTDGGEAGQ